MTKEDDVFEKEKDRITIKDFEICPVKKYFNKKSPNGFAVSGLIKIIIGSNGNGNGSQEEYVLKLKGNMKLVNYNNLSEKEKENEEIFREFNRQRSRESSNKKRRERYMEQVERYFPREELNNLFSDKSEKYPQGMMAENMNEIVADMVRGVSKNVICSNPVWQEAIMKFMKEKKYAKEGDKYVPINE